MYYPGSENKGGDQLRGYREADLRLCFRLGRLLVFPWGGSYNTVKILLNARAFIINNAFSTEGDGRLLEATLFGNVRAIIYRI